MPPPVPVLIVTCGLVICIAAELVSVIILTGVRLIVMVTGVRLTFTETVGRVTDTLTTERVTVISDILYPCWIQAVNDLVFSHINDERLPVCVNIFQTYVHGSRGECK